MIGTVVSSRHVYHLLGIFLHWISTPKYVIAVLKLNKRGLQTTVKHSSGDIVTCLGSAGPALWHLQCQMMLVLGINKSLPRGLTNAHPGQYRCRDVATTQHHFSGNISRTSWTDSSSPSSRNIKSDLFDFRTRKKRSCRELTHQVPG